MSLASCAQVLPYLLVECKASLVAQYGSHGSLLMCFKASLDSAMHTVAEDDNPDSAGHINAGGGGDRAGEGEAAVKKRRRLGRGSVVAKLAIVTRIPYFGYHATAQPFIKITLRNPSLVKRVAALLLSGAVCGQSMQPYESHVPYLLQVLRDFCSAVAASHS